MRRLGQELQSRAVGSARFLHAARSPIRPPHDGIDVPLRLVQRRRRHGGAAQRVAARRLGRRCRLSRVYPGHRQRPRARDDRPHTVAADARDVDRLRRRGRTARGAAAPQGQPREPRQPGAAPALARDSALRRRCALPPAGVGSSASASRTRRQSSRAAPCCRAWPNASATASAEGGAERTETHAPCAPRGVSSSRARASAAGSPPASRVNCCASVGSTSRTRKRVAPTVDGLSAMRAPLTPRLSSSARNPDASSRSRNEPSAMPLRIGEASPMTNRSLTPDCWRKSRARASASARVFIGGM